MRTLIMIICAVWSAGPAIVDWIEITQAVVPRVIAAENGQEGRPPPRPAALRTR